MELSESQSKLDSDPPQSKGWGRPVQEVHPLTVHGDSGGSGLDSEPNL